MRYLATCRLAVLLGLCLGSPTAGLARNPAPTKDRAQHASNPGVSFAQSDARFQARVVGRLLDFTVVEITRFEPLRTGTLKHRLYEGAKLRRLLRKLGRGSSEAGKRRLEQVRILELNELDRPQLATPTQPLSLRVADRSAGHTVPTEVALPAPPERQEQTIQQLQETVRALERRVSALSNSTAELVRERPSSPEIRVQRIPFEGGIRVPFAAGDVKRHARELGLEIVGDTADGVFGLDQRRTISVKGDSAAIAKLMRYVHQRYD